MTDFKELTDKAEKKYGLPKGALYAQMMAESAGNPAAQSPVGAKGLMQFMPDTARQYGVNVKDPASSIDGAGRYMADLLKQTGSYDKALAAYNWGIGNLTKKGMDKAPKETRDYVAKITGALKNGTKAGLDAVIPSANASEMPNTKGFDPDSYLAKKTTNNSSFDPDAYLANKMPTDATKKSGIFSTDDISISNVAPNLKALGQGFAGHAANLVDTLETVRTNTDPVAYLANKAANYVSGGKIDQLKNDRQQSLQDFEKENNNNYMYDVGGIAADTLGTAGIGGGNPVMQLASSLGSSVGGTVAKHYNATPAEQFAASVAGGVWLPTALMGVKKSADVLKAFVMSKKTDEQVLQAIKSSGVDLSNVSKEVAQSIVDDVKKSVSKGENLNPDAIRRLADYKSVGATPMQSSLTLNPADITHDRNLAKLSANSRDPVAQQLANTQRNNDIQLVTKLNELGANTQTTSYEAGQKVIESLGLKDQAAKKYIDGLYSQARATDGRSAILDPHFFTNKANDLLDYHDAGGALPGDIRNKLNGIAKGDIPLTVDVAEQLKSNLARLQRSATDGSVKFSLGQVRQALEETPLMEGQGQPAIDAFNKARQAHKAYMTMVDKIPALQAVRDGVEPDKFMQTFILGNGAKSNINDIAALKDSLKNNPEAVSQVRGQMLAYLKEKALGGKADEVANFSPSNFNSALNKIGEMKLGMFMSKEDISMLKTIGRVGSYEKFQPTGSAVNNSNTAAAVASLIDKIANSPIVRKIPIVGNEVANASQDMMAKNALNVKKAVSTPVAKQSNKFIPAGALLYGSSTSEQ